MKIYKKIDKPVLFLGLPVNLAFAYAACFVLGVIGFMACITNDKYILSAFPIGIVFYIMIRIKMFYTKYGHKGFTPAQRDKSISNTFTVDKELKKMLKK